MKIVEVAQGSEEWLRIRAGIPTASEFANLVTPLGKAKTGEMPETYLARKLAERWTGAPLPTTYSGGGLEQGNLRQDEAIPWYALARRRNIRPVGFILTDDGRVGCSPDGMFDDGTGLEVKCPDLHTHVKYLLRSELPPEYVPQVQGSMWVTGAKRWEFLSYCRNFPPLVLTVERDGAFQEILSEALDAFLVRLEAGYAKLVEINGGPPDPANAAEDSWAFDFV